MAIFNSYVSLPEGIPSVASGHHFQRRHQRLSRPLAPRCRSLAAEPRKKPRHADEGDVQRRRLGQNVVSWDGTMVKDKSMSWMEIEWAQ